MIRRLLTTLTLVYMDHGYFQSVIFLVMALMMAMYLLSVRPFKSTAEFNALIFNEIAYGC